MNYVVSEKGREPVTVGLQEVGEGHFEVHLEGATLHVDVAKSGPTVYSIIEDGHQYEAMVDERGEHGFDVLVRGFLFHLEAIDERTQVLASSAVARATGPQAVEAQMPGKIVSVAVEVGDRVAEGQGVVVVEAMKMENEIPSPIDGRVTQIGVRPGQTVESGTLLFVVEPIPEEEGAQA